MVIYIVLRTDMSTLIRSANRHQSHIHFVFKRGGATTNKVGNGMLDLIKVEQIYKAMLCMVFSVKLRFQIYVACGMPMLMQQQNGRKRHVVHSCVSICPNAIANVNSNAVKWIAPGTNRCKCKRQCNRITGNFDVPSHIWRKKDMPHATFILLIHIYGILD